MDLWQILVGDADDDAAEMLAVDGLTRLLVSKLEALDEAEPDPNLAADPVQWLRHHFPSLLLFARFHEHVTTVSHRCSIFRAY